MTDTLKNKTTGVKKKNLWSDCFDVRGSDIFTRAYKEKGDFFHNPNVKLIPQKRALRMGSLGMVPIPQSRSKTPGRNALVQSNEKGWGE